MKKQNSTTSNVGDFAGRITRARAAALCSAGQMPPSKAPTEENKKRALRGNPIRAALDENNTNVPDNPDHQHKRRAVLQDFTNVCCESSYKRCFNATKIQAKNIKQAKRGQARATKVAPSASVGQLQVQANSKTKITKDIVKEESKPEELSTNFDTDKPLLLTTIQECGIDDRRIADQRSSVSSESQSSLHKGEKGSLHGKLMTSCDPDYINIDADDTDPQLCSLYAADIYSNMRVAELIRRPSPSSMETVQCDITQTMRGILVDWLVEVSEEYKLVPDTLYMTVYLIDWFLSQNYIERQRLQLLGITCMLISSKYEEICAPRVEEFCFITDNTYTKEEVLKMEIRVLKHVGFQLFAPTAKTFLRRFLRAAQASYKSPSLELEYLANFLAELTLVDYDFLNFLPSVIAASAVFLARWTLDQSSHPWNATLEHYTTYRASDLKATVFALQDLQLNTNGCPLNAIRMKYRQQKFKSVGILTSSRLLETLF
ncbi:cyclin-A2-4 [Mangifera indica]|uniref:cyclin-A2-4 n=1 Tax=Mangifera indica TaxID=29780 RepID=UPI001CF96C63|nr:cyclin-A2-4 [Mangifera indica]XP_044495930.1 cyclin-A2-4 [Mangifera indica]